MLILHGVENAQKLRGSALLGCAEEFFGLIDRNQDLRFVRRISGAQVAGKIGERARKIV